MLVVKVCWNKLTVKQKCSVTNYRHALSTLNNVWVNVIPDLQPVKTTQKWLPYIDVLGLVW